jgi:hypothetical protein
MRHGGSCLLRIFDPEARYGACLLRNIADSCSRRASRSQIPAVHVTPCTNSLTVPAAIHWDGVPRKLFCFYCLTAKQRKLLIF